MEPPREGERVLQGWTLPRELENQAGASFSSFVPPTQYTGRDFSCSTWRWWWGSYLIGVLSSSPLFSYHTWTPLPVFPFPHLEHHGFVLSEKVPAHCWVLRRTWTKTMSSSISPFYSQEAWVRKSGPLQGILKQCSILWSLWYDCCFFLRWIHFTSFRKMLSVFFHWEYGNIFS